MTPGVPAKVIATVMGLGVIDLASEGSVHRIQIRLVAVRRDLNAIREARERQRKNRLPYSKWPTSRSSLRHGVVIRLANKVRI